MGVTRSVPEILVAAAQTSSQELGQAVEVENTSPHEIVERINGRAAILAAELYVVLSDLPRKIVKKLIVHVHAVARVGKCRGAKMREAGDINRRQTEIARQCRVWSEQVQRINSQRDVRIAEDGGVLREETVAITVPSEASLVDFLRRNRLYPAQRHELRADWGVGVCVRQVVAASDSEWKALMAVSEEIAPRNLIVCIQVVVNLCDRAVQVVCRRAANRCCRGPDVLEAGAPAGLIADGVELGDLGVHHRRRLLRHAIENCVAQCRVSAQGGYRRSVIAQLGNRI